MDSFELKDLIYISTFVATIVGTFFATKHSIKEFVRDRVDVLKDKLNEQKIEIEKLKSKTDNQQQIIDQFQKQVLDHLPDLFEIIKEKKDNGRRK
ncbi:MAG: hypothetical protein HXX16_00870 [Bacteroidales bacterium]|nr:hypothetical protein [Bacteroidales bacterium]